MRVVPRLNARMGRVAVASLVIAACIGLTACGSDSSTSAGPSDNLPSTGGPKGGPITATDIDTAHDFVGGKLGKATGSPIKVGLIQVLSGPIPRQRGHDVVRNAAQFVNEKLGGIDGHPIEFVACDTGSTDEKAQACGQKFANDPSIKAIYDPAQPTGGLATQSANNGKKLTFCGFPNTPELLAIQVFCPGGGTIAAGSTVNYFKDWVKPTPKHTAQILPDDALFKQISKVAIKQMKAAGIKATEGFVPQASADVTSSVIASGAQSADAIFVTVVSTGQCIAVAKAFKSLGIKDSVPIVSLPTCNDPVVAKALGGQIPKWTFFDNGQSAQLPNPTPEARTFLDVVQTYGKGQFGTWSTINFGTVLWMAKVMNKVGFENLSVSTMAAEAKKFTGPMFLGDPDIKFGVDPWHNAGSLRGIFYSYKGNGVFANATDGKYVDQPPLVQ